MTWSVAEGARGRRWRWTIVTGEGTLEHAGLIELDGSRRFVRLELETTLGMLTLHPASDGTAAHGNVVRIDRVDPVIVPWSTDTGILITRDPFATALLDKGRRRVTIAPDLTLSVGDPIAHDEVRDLDDRAVPRLSDPEEWPLVI